MRHRMHLEREYFQAMKDGSKKIEIRLADKKRQKLKVDDEIEFIPLKGKDQPILVKVTSLERYASFKTMYESIDWKELGTECLTMDKMLEETYKIYSPAAEEKWGVLAIGIQ